jgi:hypothetical protein
MHPGRSEIPGDSTTHSPCASDGGAVPRSPGLSGRPPAPDREHARHDAVAEHFTDLKQPPTSERRHEYRWHIETIRCKTCSIIWDEPTTSKSCRMWLRPFVPRLS